MRAYHQVVADGVKKPAKAVADKNLKGYYHSCMYKWKRQRREDSWDVICAASPRLAKKYRELPNVIRNFLGKAKKFQSRTPADDVSKTKTSILPLPFQEMVGEVVLERLEWGEEMDFHFVSSLMATAIEQWNVCVQSVREELMSPQAILQHIEEQGITEQKDIEAALESIQEQTSSLKEISLKPADGEFLFLGYGYIAHILSSGGV
eukprot:Skav223643  [mRNA]  locus=scaffold46:608748:609365:- [translate_table: standard]